MPGVSRVMDGAYAQGVRSVSQRGPRGLSWRGKAAGALVALNTVLLFFPPIPPVVKGSLWSYALKTLVVIFAALETWRMSGRVVAWWSGISRGVRWLVGVSMAAGLLAIALGIRQAAPELSVRFSAEVGLWETVSTACYACGAILLWKVSIVVQEDLRRHLRLVAAFFVVLLLEETDYAGVFGGLVGRVNGVYVGSLHDLLNLAVHGGLTPGVALSVGAAGVLAIGLLWRRGYARPHLMAETVLSGEGLWLGTGLVLLALAGVGEAGLLGSLFEDPSPEEAIEMVGSIFLLGFALGVAGGGRDRRGPTLPGAPREASPAPRRSPTPEPPGGWAEADPPGGPAGRARRSRRRARLRR